MQVRPRARRARRAGEPPWPGAADEAVNVWGVLGRGSRWWSQSQRSSRQSVDSRLPAGLKAAEGPGNLVFDPTVLNSNKIKVSVTF